MYLHYLLSSILPNRDQINLLPWSNIDIQSLLTIKPSIPRRPLCILIRQLKLKIPHQLRHQLLHLHQRNILPHTSTISTSKSNNSFIHFLGPLFIQPSLWTKFVGVLAEDSLVSMDDSRVTPDCDAGGEILSAD